MSLFTSYLNKEIRVQKEIYEMNNCMCIFKRLLNFISLSYKHNNL